MNEMVNIISSVGFPIFCCCIMFKQQNDNNKIISELRIAIHELTLEIRSYRKEG